LTRRWLIKHLGLQPSRYYQWQKRRGLDNRHNGKTPREHWLFPEEREAILSYCQDKLEEGYRRLTYMMLDADIVAVSPATTYRLLKNAGLLNRWAPSKRDAKKGFDQPLAVHEHWHIDISYVNILGTMYFMTTVLDGRSRYIVHHELRTKMTEYDVEIVTQRAKEKFPQACPRIISDNGPQFISKDFKEFIRLAGFKHVRTSPYHPQSNGKIERYHRTIKSEEIRRRAYTSIEDARLQIAGYVVHYNTVKLHSAVCYLTPEDVLKERQEHRLKERQKNSTPLEKPSIKSKITVILSIKPESVCQFPAEAVHHVVSSFKNSSS